MKKTQLISNKEFKIKSIYSFNTEDRTRSYQFFPGEYEKKEVLVCKLNFGEIDSNLSGEQCIEKLNSLPKYEYFLTIDPPYSITNSSLYFALPNMIPLKMKIEHITSTKPDALKDSVKKYFSQLLDAVDHFHTTTGEPHGDLDINDTIFVDDNDNIKLINFHYVGLDIIDTSSWAQTSSIKNPWEKYRAPESFGKHTTYSDSVSKDVWRLGVILFQLLANKPPFENTDNELGNWLKGVNAKSESEKEKEFKEKLGRRFDKKYTNDPANHSLLLEAKELICKMLTLDPTKRATPKHLLRDPWLGLLWTNAGKYIAKAREEKQKEETKTSKPSSLKDAVEIYAVAKGIMRFVPASAPSKQKTQEDDENETSKKENSTQRKQ